MTWVLDRLVNGPLGDVPDYRHDPPLWHNGELKQREGDG